MIGPDVFWKLPDDEKIGKCLKIIIPTKYHFKYTLQGSFILMLWLLLRLMSQPAAGSALERIPQELLNKLVSLRPIPDVQRQIRA